MTPAVIFAALSLAFVAALAIEVAWGTRRLLRLSNTPPIGDADAPRVTVIVAARDEAVKIEAAMRSLLALDYPDCEILAVDDRSVDGTGEILDRLAAEFPRLHVEHIHELPAGWLGKNHALHRAAQRATGEWLLFTDADVHFAPDALRRAIGLARAQRLDHLVLSLTVVPRGFWYNITLNMFMLCFLLFTRPWFVSNPRLPFHIGIGAFNLVRAEAYRRVGGHAPIAMRPDDDLKLGKLLKMNGFRQDIAFGRHAVSVEWYGGLREMIRGLEKNAFAGVNYLLSVQVLGSLALAWFFIGPFILVWMTEGPARWCYGASALLLVVMQCQHARDHGLRMRHAPWVPLGAAIMLFILWNATLRTLWHGGISWRGTFYPLKDLRKNKV